MAKSKTTLEIRSSLMNRSKHYGIDNGLTLTQVVEEALEAYLAGTIPRDKSENTGTMDILVLEQIEASLLLIQQQIRKLRANFSGESASLNTFGEDAIVDSQAKTESHPVPIAPKHKGRRQPKKAG